MSESSEQENGRGDDVIRQRAHWIDAQLSTWFGGDAEAAFQCLAHTIGMVAGSLHDGTPEEFIQSVTPPTKKLINACEGVPRGIAVGAIGGALLYLTDPRVRSHPDPDPAAAGTRPVDEGDQ